MTRPRFNPILWLLAVLVPFGAAQAGRTQAAPRPNVVFFLTDDQRWDAMSCAGNTILKTPNMDRIAAEGVRFTNAFVTYALCAPSRASFMTGTYPHTHGVIDNNNRRVKAEVRFVSEYLREAGYEVAFCGKSHTQGAYRDRPWDYYFGFQGQGNYLQPRVAEGGPDGKIGMDRPYQGWMDDVVADHAAQWIRGKREKPFALFMWFKAPHRSWNSAPRHAGLFESAVIPKPATYDEKLKGFPGKPRAFAEADNKIGNAPDVPSLDFVKAYYRTLVGVDENVGKVLKALDDTGKAPDTMVIYSSDNGFFHGEWGLYDKRLMHEPSIKVPMLVRYPKLVKPGTTNDRMVLNIDIAPTLLDLAGVPVPKTMHGRSIAPLLRGRKPDWRKDWLYEYFEFPGAHSVKKNRGVRTERHKLIHYYEEPQEWELYDLKQDPGELRNLYGDPKHADLTARLKKRMEALRRETADPDLPPTT
jgi:arylsulfatase A-like enzyme